MSILLINCAIKNENVTHQLSEGCSAVLDLHSVFPETDDKIASIPLCPGHSKNA
jgi:hypothetical protein